ncbi:hypothetical protein ACLBQE_29045, partial [Klebsiella pneumoniae]
FICSGNTMPIVLVDWSDIREQKRLMVLRASVALHGRSVTLYEKAFPLSEQCVVVKFFWTRRSDGRVMHR